MRATASEEEYNDTCERICMYQALLLKRDFTSAEPFKKCVTDITEIKAKVTVQVRMNLKLMYKYIIKT